MIDARGFSCPMPVVMVQKEVKKSAPDQLEVLVAAGSNPARDTNRFPNVGLEAAIV